MNWTNKVFNNQRVLLAVAVIIILNEFTLVFFDPSPPLSKKVLNFIRYFDVIVILFAITFNFWLKPFKIIINFSKIVIKNILLFFLLVFFLDFTLSLLGFGHRTSYNQENIERYPYPSDGFRGKPNASNHNQYGFRGDFISSIDSFNVAIFGGSTTYNGAPPIIDMVGENLKNKGLKISTFNFGSISSNHSQHVHRLLDFSDKFKFDLIIFYGGGNETLQYVSTDPRPGYPYNFFFRNELNPLIQSLLRYSSILGTIDIYTDGFISGLKNLKKETQISGWKNDIVSNYWRDLTLANSITSNIVKPNICSRSKFLSVLQPLNPHSALEVSVWTRLVESQTKFNNSFEHLDLSKLSDNIVFTDPVHVTQPSRKLIAAELSSVVEKMITDWCK